MQFWKRVLATSLGVLGLAAFVQAQTGGATSVHVAVRRPARETQPETYGTLNLSYYNIDAAEFMPTSSSVTYASLPGTFTRYSDNCTGPCLAAALHIPSGAMLQSLELDYYDNAAAGEAIALLRICDYNGQGCSGPATCPDGSTACSGVPDTDGYSYRLVDLTAANIQINNYYNRYYVFVGTTNGDGSTAINRISIGYKLQVSPGPATATFSDVPTSHPFFKFVEALHAAGISNGYPDGRFGVNDPITRGQMAVFLSAALGLNWP